MSKQFAAARTILSCVSEVGFLGFLYPSRTLAIVQQIVNRNRARLDSRQGIRCAPLASRTYSSIASDPTNVTGNVKDATASAGSLQSAKPEEPASKPSPEYYSDRMEVDLILAELFESSNKEPDHERAWHCYQNLQNISEDLTYQQLINILRYLTTEPTPLSSERAILLVEKIPLTERHEFHHKTAIRAALSQDALGTAMEFHRKSLRQIIHTEGTSLILRYAVEREKWNEAIETLNDYFHEHCRHNQVDMNYQAMWKGIHRSSIWHDVHRLPFWILVKKAAAAVKFAVEAAKTGAMETAIHAQRFALEVITEAFSVQVNKVDVVAHRKLFNAAKTLKEGLKTPTSLLYNRAIGQLLNTNLKSHEKVAIEYYRNLKKEEWVPHVKILHALRKRFCAAGDATGIFEIIDQYRNHYWEIPLSELRRMIPVLSRQGDAESVQGLFREYVERSGKPTDYMFDSLLHVYHRRAEPHHVVKCFHDLQKEYGFVPSISSWNYVIGTHARVGDVEGAMSWFDRLFKAGKQPDARSYTSLMQMYAKRGDLEAVQRLLRQSEAAGIKSSIGMIDSLVLGLIKNDMLDDATNLVEEALQMEFEHPRTHMWNYLINAHAMRGDLVRVMATHKRMREVAVPLDATSYSALLHSLAFQKQPEAAHKILRSILPRAGIQPNPLHYATVMAGYFEIKLYNEVLMLYCDMLKNKVSPTQSTQTVLLRSVAALETQNNDGVEQPKELLRTQAVLKQILANMNPADFAPSRPTRFVGPNRLDEAFTSTNFSQLVFIYGKKAAFDKVKELYDQYLATAMRFQGNIDFIPPIEMLSALLSANAEARDYEEVDRCWHLAVEKAEQLARPSGIVDGKPWRALYSRRFILNLPLPIYIRCLETQNKIDNIPTTVDNLLNLGYQFHSSFWNAYVQILARNGHEKLAFTLCERELMADWLGWESLGHRRGLMRKFERIEPDGKRPIKRFPAYPTLVYLAAAYIKIRSKDAEVARELAQVAPKAMNAVANMPQLDDELQASLLGNVQDR